jgi:hypothetical protein
MATEQPEYEPDLSRRDGYEVIRHIEGHLQLIIFPRKSRTRKTRPSRAIVPCS